MLSIIPRTAAKVNYLNNRDILKQIHLSKNTYCSFRDPQNDHQYDIILSNVDKINVRTVAEARRNRAARIAKETGEDVNEKKIPYTDLVFRITCWDHIPLAPKKPAKKNIKKSSGIEELLDLEEEVTVEEEVEDVILDPTHVRVNFPPFWHYRLNEDKTPFVVGKSHWRGDLDSGELSKEHGNMTRRLAEMFIKLCERYATRSNWRGYTYNEEMRGQALLQLSQIGLQFDESKS